MIETLQMVFFGILACSTLVATCLMMVNFPRIRAGNQAVMFILKDMGETNRVVFEVVHAKLDQLDERVKDLERTHG